MIVYLVQGNSILEETPGTSIECNYVYGIFSSMEKANEIANQLRRNILERNETEEVTVTELKIDEPTEDYYFMLNN